jgi:hypothetical protein
MFGFSALERRTTFRGKRPRKRRDETGAANASIITETTRNFERFFKIFADSAVEKKTRKRKKTPSGKLGVLRS